jgi:hypothetical protein
MLRQEDHRFEASLGYIADPVSEEREREQRWRGGGGKEGRGERERDRQRDLCFSVCFQLYLKIQCSYADIRSRANTTRGWDFDHMIKREHTREI